MMSKRYTLTKHARERMEQQGVTDKFVEKYFQNSSKNQLKKMLEAYKFGTYGLKQLDIEYHRTALDAVFTVNKEKDGSYTIITVTVRLPREHS